MIWGFADITTDIAQNVYLQLGAVGLVILILAYLLYDTRKENRLLREENRDLMNKRLQDVIDMAKIQSQPNDELQKFVRTLYELSINSSKPGA